MLLPKRVREFLKRKKDGCCLHTIKPANRKSKTKKRLSYTDVFADWIYKKVKVDKRVQVVTPAMCTGSGLVKFSKKYSQKFYDVGIAEQHAITLAGGLASQGLKPVVAIYFTFL